MSLVDRVYPEIVRDMLTTLTGGITGEVHPVVYAGDDAVAPEPIVLTRRPVQRVSFLSGSIAGRDNKLVPFVFGLNDYELFASSSASPDALDAIRFLPFGRRPAKGTDVIINYYPRNAAATALTDVQVGSVARTLLESVAREIAALYAQVNLAYDAAFLDTATGASLDRVVALLGFRRLRAGRAAGFATFTRRAGSPGDITIPAGTPITDAEDKIRYETSENYLMRSGESTALVRIRGAAEATPVIEANKLTVIARLVAGLSEVTNEHETTRATDDESDEDLRLRARDALTAVDKGTLEALRHGLLQLEDVRDVRIEEMPNDVAGEINLVLSLSPGADQDRVTDRIEELRPAGVHVTWKQDDLKLQARLRLTLAGSSLPVDTMQNVESGAVQTLVKAIAARNIGEKVRIKPLVAALLADTRIADVTLELGVKDESLSATNDVAVPAGKAASLTASDISVQPSVFEAAPAGMTRLDVTARMGVSLITGTNIDQARNAIRAKLETFLGALTAGRTVDTQALLLALRDDSKYAINAQTLLVTIGSGSESAMVALNGASFTVKADQQFQLGTFVVDERETIPLFISIIDNDGLQL